MNKALLSALVVILAAGAAARGEAASSSTAMAFLDLGAGARSAALAGAVSGVVTDATATYWNPAGLTRINGWDLTGTHTEWLQDIRYEHVSLARNRGRVGIGFSFATAYASNFDGRDEVGNPGLSFGFSDVSLGLSGAYALGDRLSLGVTGKYYRESIDDFVGDGMAFDLGARYETPVDGLTAGATLRNLGSQVKFDVQNAGSFDIPRTFQAGLAYQRPIHPLSGSLLLSGDVIAEKNQDTSFRMGIEYRYRDAFGLLFGYRADTGGNSTSASGQKLQDTQNVSFGASLDKGLRFEYAFVPFYSDLGSTHRFSVGKRW